MSDNLRELTESYLELRTQADTLSKAAEAVKGQIEAKIAAIRADNPEASKWAFEKTTAVWVQPSPRTSLDRALLVQNGVTADVLEKSTVSKPVRGYVKVEAVRAQED
jgi:hypothetical protein